MLHHYVADRRQTVSYPQASMQNQNTSERGIVGCVATPAESCHDDCSTRHSSHRMRGHYESLRSCALVSRSSTRFILASRQSALPLQAAQAPSHVTTHTRIANTSDTAAVACEVSTTRGNFNLQLQQRNPARRVIGTVNVCWGIVSAHPVRTNAAKTAQIGQQFRIMGVQ